MPVRPIPAPAQQPPGLDIPVPPDRDPIELARRLLVRSGQPGAPAPATPSAARLPREGDREEMWVLQDGRGGQQVAAVVRRATEHAVWLFEEGAKFDPAALDRAVLTFEERIWPGVTRLFGDLGGPGLNGDPRITIFHTSLEDGLAGYFSSSDEFPSDVHPFSNQRKIIYVDTRKLALGADSYNNVLAHELQHAVHFAADPGEDTWVNEGLSEVAIQKAGFQASSAPAFLANANVQLNVWPGSGRDTGPHYGAAMLFFEYLLEHYGGDDSIRRLVTRQEDGLAGIDAYLTEQGHRERATDVFRDWVVANYVDEEGTRFGYSRRRLGPIIARTLAGNETVTGRSAQMGATYYAAGSDSAGFTLRFEGDASGALLPVQPRSARSCWWGNQGDSIDTSLTRAVDLTGVTNATLRFDVWYAIEDEWDYAYVEASEDDGRTWTILEGLHSTARNSNGSAFGPGYTGESGGWLSEQINLSRFAGKRILLRLEYVTDDAVHQQGICFDDFEVREIGWFDFAESDRDWENRGFVRAGSAVPQRWLVQVIRTGGGLPVRTVEVPIDASGEGEYRVELGPGEAAVVVVSAISPESMSPAAYTLKVSPLVAPGE